MQRFRGGLVLEAHSLCVSLKFRLRSDKEEEEEVGSRVIKKEKQEKFGTSSPHEPARGSCGGSRVHSCVSLFRAAERTAIGGKERSKFENICFTEMCSGSEAVSY